ncbi:MAG TPA: glycosyltransferase family 2 protein [Acidimicrobiales bacterium]|nr:glycosyltransferase family 2 protein [Acidimicrobiales bacterium]
MITAVGVVIPARDEADHIGLCLQSVHRALSVLPPATDTAVWVVVDRCTDATAELVRLNLAGRGGCGWEVSDRDRPVGTLRDRGNRAVLDLLGGHLPGNIWLLNTDADTVVPPGWAAGHVALAEDGADAVAGIADLAAAPAQPLAAARYRELIARHRHGAVHDHVYGANLGVRASAYLRVGGFAPRSTGEDVDLVRRLRRGGYEVVAPVHVRVRTSARTVGRAPGGLADLLSSLERGATGPAAAV